MRWQGRRQSGNVIDQRKFGAGSMGIGGLLIGAVVYFLMGGDPLSYLAQNASEVGVSGSSSGTTEADDQRKNFASVVLADTEDVWSEQFARHSVQYQPTQMVLFRGRVDSGCGAASSQVGPFYCGADQRVYLDLDFFDELANKLGAKGDAASAYVIAHEVGHHIQNILGLDRQSRGRTNQASVETELQADCFAGIWAAHVNRKSLFEEGDIEEAMGAASSVGDDRLQSMAGNEVQPDSFTHGSSAQRVAAFRHGFDGGNLESCVNPR